MNAKKLKLLHRINKVLIKFPLLGQSISNIIYWLLEGKRNCNLFDISNQAERAKIAEKTLHNIHKDSHSSALTNNLISGQKVDLQIIMPVYNTEIYLEESIQSVLEQQTKYSWHLVIINDGSPDNSAEKLKKYDSEQNITIITQENKGFSGARNSGLRNIFGKYIAFLDSDDVLAPNAIENWLDAAYNNDADVIDGGFFRRTTEGRLYSKFVHTSQNSGSGFMCTRVFRSDLFENIKFPENYWFEDTIYAFLIKPKASKIIQIPQIVYYYTSNPKGISNSHSGKPKSIDAFYIVRALARDCKKLHNSYGNSEWDINTILKHFQIMWHRTHLLGIEVEESIFVLSCELWHKYYNCDIKAASQLRLLQKALNEYTFNLYRRECIFKT